MLLFVFNQDGGGSGINSTGTNPLASSGGLGFNNLGGVGGVGGGGRGL
jgi:hypothetical protein